MSGTSHSGTVSAESQDEALKKIQQQGLVVIDLQLSRDIAHTLKSGSGLKSIFQKRVPERDLAIMARQFSVLYNAGVTIIKSLHTVYKQTQQPELKDTLRKVAMHVESGLGLGEAMKRYPDVFPAIFYNMVAAGEVAGSLDEVLDRAANHFEREHEIGAKVKAALFYPKMVVGVIIIVCAFLIAFVVPKFAELFSGMGVDLPLPTRMLIGLGTILTSWWWLIGLIFIGMYALFSWYRSTPPGKVVFDRMALHVPIFGELNRKNFVSRFCRSLSTLTRSGVPIIPAMMLVRQTLGNAIIAESLSSAQEAIRTGQGIAPQLEKSGYFPPLVIQMVEVGEETGSLDIMLERASDFYDAEIKAMTEQMTQLIEPIVFLILGVIVTFIILAIMLPMFDSLKMVG